MDYFIGGVIPVKSFCDANLQNFKPTNTIKVFNHRTDRSVAINKYRFTKEKLVLQATTGYDYNYLNDFKNYKPHIEKKIKLLKLREQVDNLNSELEKYNYSNIFELNKSVLLTNKARIESYIKSQFDLYKNTNKVEINSVPSIKALSQALDSVTTLDNVKSLFNFEIIDENISIGKLNNEKMLENSVMELTSDYLVNTITPIIYNMINNINKYKMKVNNSNINFKVIYDGSEIKQNITLNDILNFIADNSMKYDRYDEINIITEINKLKEDLEKNHTTLSMKEKNEIMLTETLLLILNPFTDIIEKYNKDINDKLFNLERINKDISDIFTNLKKNYSYDNEIDSLKNININLNSILRNTIDSFNGHSNGFISYVKDDFRKKYNEVSERLNDSLNAGMLDDLVLLNHKAFVYFLEYIDKHINNIKHNFLNLNIRNISEKEYSKEELENEIKTILDEYKLQVKDYIYSFKKYVNDMKPQIWERDNKESYRLENSIVEHLKSGKYYIDSGLDEFIENHFNIFYKEYENKIQYWINWYDKDKKRNDNINSQLQSEKDKILAIYAEVEKNIKEKKIDIFYNKLEDPTVPNIKSPNELIQYKYFKPRPYSEVIIGFKEILYKSSKLLSYVDLYKKVNSYDPYLQQKSIQKDLNNIKEKEKTLTEEKIILDKDLNEVSKQFYDEIQTHKEFILNSVKVENDIDLDKMKLTVQSILDLVKTQYTQDDIIDLTGTGFFSDESFNTLNNILNDLPQIIKSTLLTSYVADMNRKYKYLDNNDGVKVHRIENKDLPEFYDALDFQILSSNKFIVERGQYNEKGYIDSNEKLILNNLGFNHKGHSLDSIDIYSGKHFPLFIDKTTLTIYSLEWTTNFPTITITMLEPTTALMYNHYLENNPSKIYETKIETKMDYDKFSFDNRKNSLEIYQNNISRVSEIFNIIQANQKIILESDSINSLFVTLDENYVENPEYIEGNVGFTTRADLNRISEFKNSFNKNVSIDDVINRLYPTNGIIQTGDNNIDANITKVIKFNYDNKYENLEKAKKMLTNSVLYESIKTEPELIKEFIQYVVGDIDKIKSTKLKLLLDSNPQMLMSLISEEDRTKYKNIKQYR